MNEKEPHATRQSDQPRESEQQMKASKNGVFLMRGKGQMTIPVKSPPKSGGNRHSNPEEVATP